MTQVAIPGGMKPEGVAGMARPVAVGKNRSSAECGDAQEGGVSGFAAVMAMVLESANAFTRLDSAAEAGCRTEAADGAIEGARAVAETEVDMMPLTGTFGRPAAPDDAPNLVAPFSPMGEVEAGAGAFVDEIPHGTSSGASLVQTSQVELPGGEGAMSGRWGLRLDETRSVGPTDTEIECRSSEGEDESAVDARPMIIEPPAEGLASAEASGDAGGPERAKTQHVPPLEDGRRTSRRDGMASRAAGRLVDKPSDDIQQGVGNATSVDHPDGGVRAHGRSEGVSHGDVDRPDFEVIQQDVAGQLVREARMLRYPERTEVEIRLKPEFLGKVTLKLAVQGANLSARFTVESHEVKRAIESCAAELKENLSAQGLHISGLSVQIDDGGRRAPWSGEDPGLALIEGRDVGSREGPETSTRGGVFFRRPIEGALDVVA